jgi:phospholipase C
VRPRTPVEHLVVVMLENRSVDHYLGWYGEENPAFDGTRTGSYVDASGATVPTADWGASGRNNFHGRGFNDPGHGWKAARAEFNEGKLDGFLSEGSGNDEFAVSTYGPDDLPIWAQLARGFTTFDRWHASLLGPTQPNRYYLHSAQSAGLKDNSLPPQVASDHPEWTLGWDWPTVWDLCGAGGVSCAYYYCNLPQIAYWGPRHLDVARHISAYYEDAALGRLPQVSFIDPWYIAPEGLANDDHPHADIRLGQEFLSDVVGAFVESPLFAKAALVVTYDEWGGFWDHVRPPRVPDERASKDLAEDFGQTGFRVPSVCVSPWTQGGRVDHGVHDHVSVLRFISDNWGLPSLNLRHRKATSLASAFDGFRSYAPEFELVPYTAPAEARVEPTLEQTPAGDLHLLAELGWFEKFGFRTDHRFEDTLRRSLR